MDDFHAVNDSTFLSKWNDEFCLTEVPNSQRLFRRMEFVWLTGFAKIGFQPR